MRLQFVYICTFALFFTEAPSITHPTAASASYNEGRPVNISCTATGKPYPDVRWIHRGQVKSFGSKSADLTFSRISKSDAGMYTCRANNSAESTEKQLNLVINCKYVNSNIHFNYIINVMKKNKLLCVCRIFLLLLLLQSFHLCAIQFSSAVV